MWEFIHPAEKCTHFLLIWYRNNRRLTFAIPLNNVREAWFSNCSWRRSSILKSWEAIRFVIPNVLLKTSTVKTPGWLDDMTKSILSNWRGEYVSSESRIFFSYQLFAVYLKEPNCGVLPAFWRSRRWKYCFVNGKTTRVFLLFEFWVSGGLKDRLVLFTLCSFA